MRPFPILLSLIISLYLLSDLAGQRLQDEALGYLLGGSVYPQDRVLGLLYIPEGALRDSQQIFELVRDFWNQVNASKLETMLLSRDGQVQVREQIAPFIQDTPHLYRESLKIPAQQFQEAHPDETSDESPSVNDAGTQEAESRENQLPRNYLQLSLVRLGEPVIENDYARARCRLKIKNNSAFIQVEMYFLMEDDTWKIDALDVDWENIQTRGTKAIDFFGRKQELYPQ